MSYLRYLCLFTYSSVQQLLCCVFVSFVLSCVSYLASFSVLSIFYFPVGILYRYLLEIQLADEHDHGDCAYDIIFAISFTVILRLEIRKVITCVDNILSHFGIK